MTKLATMGELKGKPLRPVQEQAVEFIKGSKKRFIVVRGPTGIGKSCVGIESMPKPFFYICSSIALEEQLVNDYPEAAILKGRGNYDCETFGTCDLCVRTQPCAECEYQKAKSIAMGNEITILNFHYFLYASNFTQQGLGLRNIIIDEADSLETILTNFISFDFYAEQFKHLGLKVSPPSRKTKVEVMSEWLGDLAGTTGNEISRLKSVVQDIRENTYGRRPTTFEITQLRRFRGLSSLYWKSNYLAKKNLEDNWIYQYSDFKQRITLKPKWLTRDLVDKFLFDHGDRFLFMSATVPSRPMFSGLFGIKSKELDYLDLPNIWESEERKIIYRPRYNITYKNKGKELDKLVRDAVAEVMEDHGGRGVIHTVSYGWAEILKGLDDRLVFHDSKDKKRKFEYFKETSGAVWVSPSSSRGIDLPDDLCEWIIVLKAAFGYLKDPHISARVYGSGKFGQEWYASDCVQSIVQSIGRGFRHEKDFCTIYLIDEQIGKLLQRHASLFPMWIRDMIRYK